MPVPPIRRYATPSNCGYFSAVVKRTEAAPRVSAMADRFAEVRDKVFAGTRLTFDDGLALERQPDPFALGELANFVRERKNGNRTYYNVNTHLNPTNVC